MNDQDRLKLEARLAAIEHMLMHLYAAQIGQADTPLAAVDHMEQSWRHGLGSQTIPGLPPEQSDLIAAEVSQEILRLISGIREHLKNRGHTS